MEWQLSNMSKFWWCFGILCPHIMLIVGFFLFTNFSCLFILCIEFLAADSIYILLSLYCLLANSLLIFGAFKRRKDLILAWLGVFGFVLAGYSCVFVDEFLNHIEDKKFLSFIMTKCFFTAGKKTILFFSTLIRRLF